MLQQSKLPESAFIKVNKMRWEIIPPHSLKQRNAAIQDFELILPLEVRAADDHWAQS